MNLDPGSWTFSEFQTMVVHTKYICFRSLTCSCNGLSPDAAAAAIVDGMNCIG